MLVTSLYPLNAHAHPQQSLHDEFSSPKFGFQARILHSKNEPACPTTIATMLMQQLLVSLFVSSHWLDEANRYAHHLNQQ